MSQQSIEASRVTQEAVQIGSFSLETLTTGMSEDPFHCLREYVQNSFDAVRDAVRGGLLKDNEGRITIQVAGTSARPSLSVRDNGAGIPAVQAVSTLVSIGASRKTPAQHAGFRGIGRLAGIAYTTTLRFTTKAAGDTTATVVEFDCGQLRGYMKPGAEPQDVRDVIRACTNWRSIPEREHEHYTEVEMIGLTNLGLEFAEREKLLSYLKQICPVEYSEQFSFGDRIRSLATSFGEKIPVVDVEIKHRKERTQVLKPYQISSPIGGQKKNQSSHISDIETLVSKELGWYGWIGRSNFPGEIVDDTVASVRFRVKNIQIDNSGIIESIAEELTEAGTERRLQRYAVGEVFIINTQVVPNARRDGFEDNQAWRDIRNDIKTRVARRVVTLVRGTSTSRAAIKRVKSKVADVKSNLNAPKLPQATAAKLGSDLRKQLALLEADKLIGADPKEVSALVSQVKSLQERLTGIAIQEPPPSSVSPRPSQPMPPQPTVPQKTALEIVQEVLSDELGTEEAERLMALIEDRIEAELTQN